MTSRDAFTGLTPAATLAAERDVVLRSRLTRALLPGRVRVGG